MVALSAWGAVVGSVRGVIHDPQHRPVANAMVMIKAKNSDWGATMNSEANGEFVFNAVPLGEYTVSVSGTGFEQTQQDVLVASGSEPVLHFALNVAGSKGDGECNGQCGRGADRFAYSDDGSGSRRRLP